jgi:SAM-dependent methyltransferase
LAPSSAGWYGVAGSSVLYAAVRAPRPPLRRRGEPVADNVPTGVYGTLQVPNLARVYNYWVGGKDSYLPDREVAAEVIRHRPQVLVATQANRAFGRRVTWYAANGGGIRQFLDIGTGLPAPGATHETAQQANRDCRVVYVDNDPVVLSNARALLTPSAGGICDYIEADVRDPGRLLADAAGTLDFTEPVAILLLAILHFIPDEDDPGGIVAELAAALAPGSLIAISHVTADYALGSVTEAIAAYNKRMPVPLYARDRAEVAGLFGELPVCWPGVVSVTRWRPSFQESPGRPVDMYGGIAQIPRTEEQEECDAVVQLGALPPATSPECDELAERAAEYPGHRISREVTGDRIRYVACSVRPGSRPHTVITTSPEELFAELATAHRSCLLSTPVDDSAADPPQPDALPGQAT